MLTIWLTDCIRNNGSLITLESEGPQGGPPPGTTSCYPCPLSFSWPVRHDLNESSSCYDKTPYGFLEVRDRLLYHDADEPISPPLPNSTRLGVRTMHLAEVLALTNDLEDSTLECGNATSYVTGAERLIGTWVPSNVRSLGAVYSLCALYGF